MIEITDTTLKRLGNYEAVVLRRCQEVEKRQWRVMSLEVMQEAETARAEARSVAAAVAYARYLHGIQSGRRPQRSIYGEPLLSSSLAGLMQELQIEPRPVSSPESPPVQ